MTRVKSFNDDLTRLLAELEFQHSRIHLGLTRQEGIFRQTLGCKGQRESYGAFSYGA